MPGRRSTDEPYESLPESAMGGASDSGASGGHPASHPEPALEGLSPLPEDALGDAAIERRHHHDASYRGPERREGMR